jgi:hypothetical protein
MTDIFAVEMPTRTAGLAVRAEAGFRFYASDQTFAALEGRSYDRLEDIHADVRRLAKAPRVPTLSRPRSRRRAQRSRQGGA